MISPLSAGRDGPDAEALKEPARSRGVKAASSARGPNPRWAWLRANGALRVPEEVLTAAERRAAAMVDAREQGQHP
jgi:hypothetical protein